MTPTLDEWKSVAPQGDVLGNASNYDPWLTVRIIRTEHEIEQLRETWKSWTGHRDSDIDFYLEIVRSEKDAIRPHVIMLYFEGCPEAMLIGRLTYKRVDYRIGYLRVVAMRARVLDFVYGGLRGNTSNQNVKKLIQSVQDSLAQGEADMALFEYVDRDSPLFRKILEMPGFFTRDYGCQPQPHYLMKLSDTVEDVYLGLSAKHRKHLRSESKKLQTKFDGQLKISCFRDSSGLEAVIEQVEDVAKKTYQRGLGVGFRDTPEMRERLRAYAAWGWLRGYVLYIGERPSAFWLGTVCDEIFSSDHLGFDPYFREYSPGTFLMMRAIESLCKEGVKKIDFGFGEGMYKERFGNSKLLEAPMCIFAPSVKGLLLNWTRVLTTVIDQSLRMILERTHVLSRVKKAWRQALRDRAQATATGTVDKRA